MFAAGKCWGSWRQSGNWCGKGCIGKVKGSVAWTTASDWTVQNFHSLMLMEKTWQSYSLKYRPTFLALRASNCMCFLPLKVSGKLYSLSFGESWASQEELDFHLPL